jgi:hypothetical protein
MVDPRQLPVLFEAASLHDAGGLEPSAIEFFHRHHQHRSGYHILGSD